MIFAATLMLQVSFSSCQASLDDQAEKEAREYTRKNCPMVMGPNQRIDSMTFDRKTRTISYCYTLFGEIDDPTIMAQNKEQFDDMLYKGYKKRPRTEKIPGEKLYSEVYISLRTEPRAATVRSNVQRRIT